MPLYSEHCQPSQRCLFTQSTASLRSSLSVAPSRRTVAVTPSSRYYEPRRRRPRGGRALLVGRRRRGDAARLGRPGHRRTCVAVPRARLRARATTNKGPPRLRRRHAPGPGVRGRHAMFGGRSARRRRYHTRRGRAVALRRPGRARRGLWVFAANNERPGPLSVKGERAAGIEEEHAAAAAV